MKKWRDPPVEHNLDLSVLRPLRPPPVMGLVHAPARLEPLTFENAPGRRVLVPESHWEEYPCEEHRAGGKDRGEGWEAIVKRTTHNGRNEVTRERVDAAFVAENAFPGSMLVHDLNCY